MKIVYSSRMHFCSLFPGTSSSGREMWWETYKKNDYHRCSAK